MLDRVLASPTQPGLGGKLCFDSCFSTSLKTKQKTNLFFWPSSVHLAEMSSGQIEFLDEVEQTLTDLKIFFWTIAEKNRRLSPHILVSPHVENTVARRISAVVFTSQSVYSNFTWVENLKCLCQNTVGGREITNTKISSCTNIAIWMWAVARPKKQFK